LQGAICVSLVGRFYDRLRALGFYTSARVAEQVRAGILSLARGQGMAALALGLTQPQAYIYVLRIFAPHRAAEKRIPIPR
jgi:ABC-type amino acid transport system permease subunit